MIGQSWYIFSYLQLLYVGIYGGMKFVSIKHSEKFPNGFGLEDALIFVVVCQ
jgi:hypothetical protein